VVDVRDDGDVADVLPLRHASDVRRGAGNWGPFAAAAVGIAAYSGRRQDL
jgi:hypothetical protein